MIALHNQKFFILLMVLYLVFFASTKYLIIPFQLKFPVILPEYGAIIFIPSACRILMIWLWGFKGFLGVVVISILTMIIFEPKNSYDFNAVAVSIMSPLITFIGFNLVGALRINRLSPTYKTSMFCSMVLAVFVAALCNSLVMAYFWAQEGFLKVIYTVLIGDILGAIIGLFLIVPFVKKMLKTYM